MVPRAAAAEISAANGRPLQLPATKPANTASARSLATAISPFSSSMQRPCCMVSSAVSSSSASRAASTRPCTARSRMVRILAGDLAQRHGKGRAARREQCRVQRPSSSRPSPGRRCRSASPGSSAAGRRRSCAPATPTSTDDGDDEAAQLGERGVDDEEAVAASRSRRAPRWRRRRWSRAVPSARRRRHRLGRRWRARTPACRYDARNADQQRSRAAISSSTGELGFEPGGNRNSRRQRAKHHDAPVRIERPDHRDVVERRQRLVRWLEHRPHQGKRRSKPGEALMPLPRRRAYVRVMRSREFGGQSRQTRLRWFMLRWANRLPVAGLSCSVTIWSALVARNSGTSAAQSMMPSPVAVQPSSVGGARAARCP